MNLYIFADALTGEMQQPILAHNDEEAIRIACMAFANVPEQILRDLYLAKVVCYDREADPKFSLSPLFRGFDFMADRDSDHDA